MPGGTRLFVMQNARGKSLRKKSAYGITQNGRRREIPDGQHVANVMSYREAAIASLTLAAMSRCLPAAPPVTAHVLFPAEPEARVGTDPVTRSRAHGCLRTETSLRTPAKCANSQPRGAHTSPYPPRGCNPTGGTQLRPGVAPARACRVETRWASAHCTCHTSRQPTSATPQVSRLVWRGVVILFAVVLGGGYGVRASRCD